MRGISQCETWDSQLSDEKFRSAALSSTIEWAQTSFSKSSREMRANAMHLNCAPSEWQSKVILRCRRRILNPCPDQHPISPRLPWSRFHLLVVVGLGITWILDALEVTIICSLGLSTETLPAPTLEVASFLAAA